MRVLVSYPGCQGGGARTPKHYPPGPFGQVVLSVHGSYKLADVRDSLLSGQVFEVCITHVTEKNGGLGHIQQGLLYVFTCCVIVGINKPYSRRKVLFVTFVGYVCIKYYPGILSERKLSLI